MREQKGYQPEVYMLSSIKSSGKSKIKGFRKKSIWPSIIMFGIFIVLCFVLVAAFVGVFEMYVVDTKMNEISENVQHLGRMVTGRMREENLLDAVRNVGGYLKKEDDLCVTDEEYHVLLHIGETQLPDFGNTEPIRHLEEELFIPGVGIEIMDEAGIIPGRGIEIVDGKGSLVLPFRILWERTMRPLEKKDGIRNEEEWYKEVIYAADYWKEIPVGVKGYRVFYKDSLTLQRNDVIYMLAVVVIALIFLAIPIIFLFVNVLSTIVMQRRMIRLLYLDTTTGGRNWLYFVQYSKRILCRIRNCRNTYAVVNLHMDRYQDCCACYGVKAGEKLLENIDGFLQAKTGRGEIFARFSGADFGLLLRCDSAQEAEKRMKKMLAELIGIKQEGKLEYHAGIYIIQPVTGEKDNGMQSRRQLDPDQIYHYASTARATLDGKDGQHIRMFDQQILDEYLWKHKVEDSMEMALVNKEFQIYLQPKYSPVAGKIVGAEALVRWLSPTDGLIPPKRFIPILEENGFITKLDDYMISGVARLQSEWKLQGKKMIPVSVNVSRANFTKENLAEHICHLVDGYGADHAGIELEVTESAFFGDKDRLQKIIRELKMYGFHISMDDFGAGYSSLNSLKDLPIDVLKLDMEFFRSGQDRDSRKRGEIVVTKAIQLAKNLNMKIVAEGIERKEQVDFLAAQGCDMIQGFYYAKPMTIQEFDERIGQEQG